jgi:hypothetical protein
MPKATAVKMDQGDCSEELPLRKLALNSEAKLVLNLLGKRYDLVSTTKNPALKPSRLS